MRHLLLLGLLTASLASAYEPARREAIDAGVHVPVLTKAPELIDFVQADYPPDAFARGQTAAVKLAVTIAEDGTVAEALVTGPAGDGFDEAAKAAVLKFRFTAAEVDGVPSPVQIEYVYNFVLAPTEDAGVPEDAGVAKGPRATLTGELVIRGNRSRISGGTVRCANEEGGPEAVSDEQGHFTLDVPVPLCSVVVSMSGYYPFETEEAELQENEKREVVYYVLEKNVGYQTVVRGQREKKEVVRRTIERAELQKVPGTFGDPIRVIQNFPGVARAPFLGGQLIVRGANPSQTLTFLDGVEIPLLFHLGGGPSVINSEFIDKIDFYPGGFGARYGRAVGGIVDVSTRKGASDTWHGVAQADFQGASAFLEVPVTKNVSVAGAVRRSYIDALIPLVLPQNPNGGTLLVLPVYWDYQVRVDLGSTRGQNGLNTSSYSLMAFGSDDLLKVVASGGAATGIANDLSVEVHTLFHRLVGNWTYRGQDAAFKLTPYLGYDLAHVNIGTIKLDADRYTAGLRADFGTDVNKYFTVRAGADIFGEVLYGVAELPVIGDIQYVEFPGEEPVRQVQKVARLPMTFDGALYLEGDLKFGPVTFTPGLRASTANIYGQTRHAIEPRLWARLELFEGKTQLKGSVGLYTQPPESTSMEPPPFGNPGLTHEKAFQSSLGIWQRITDNINVDVTGFYNRRFENVASPGPTTRNPDGSITQLLSANTGLGRAYGAEVMLRHEVTANFFGWLAYTISRSEATRAGSGDPYVITQFDQTHILTVIGSYRFPTFCSKAALCAGWEVGGRFRYVTGQPTSPLIHDYDLYRNDANNFASTRGPARSARLKDFNQLDVRIDKSFPFDRFTLGVYLDIQNVYNAQNVETSFTDYRQRQTYPVTGIPFLPILGLKASF